MKLTQGWIGNIFYCLLGVLFAVIFHYGILRFALATDLPMVAVLSNSMKHDSSVDIYHYQWLEKNLGYNESYIKSWPIAKGFAKGDMPIVKGSDEYKVGDVIVYDAGQEVPIIHRIIKINEDGTYQTKGDNNPGQYPYELSVSKEQIHGKVVFVIPKLGYVKVAFHYVFHYIKVTFSKLLGM